MFASTKESRWQRIGKEHAQHVCASSKGLLSDLVLLVDSPPQSVRNSTGEESPVASTGSGTPSDGRYALQIMLRCTWLCGAFFVG